jgi:hypothetical protein
MTSPRYQPHRVERYRPQQCTADLLPRVQWTVQEDTTPTPTPMRTGTRELLNKLVSSIKRKNGGRRYE